ncbi:MAG TPA: hypothetical protein VEI02_03605 [Planctomycetota bacterium]|nr:hypothetical protein [Planctomycetota bacterium]
MKSISMRAVAALVLLAGAASAQTFLSLNPKQTYLRVNSDSGVLSSTAHSLASLGLTPGGWCTLQQTGDWKAGPPYVDTSRTLLGVFSTSATLLSGSTPNRVPDAVGGTGAPFVTANTWNGSFPTDIPHDFRISAHAPGPHQTFLRVPPTAQYLFFAVHDSLYGDNTDPDADHGVWITSEPTPWAPGTSDDLDVGTGVNAPATSGAASDLKFALPNDAVTFELTSPFGTFAGENVLFGLQLGLAATPLAPYYGLPELWVDPFSPLFIPLVPTFSPLPAAGLSFTLTVPPGLAGFAVVAQGVAVTSKARNGVYAAANAHIVVFL